MRCVCVCVCERERERERENQVTGNEMVQWGPSENSNEFWHLVTSKKVNQMTEWVFSVAGNLLTVAADVILNAPDCYKWGETLLNVCVSLACLHLVRWWIGQLIGGVERSGRWIKVKSRKCTKVSFLNETIHSELLADHKVKGVNNYLTIPLELIDLRVVFELTRKSFVNSLTQSQSMWMHSSSNVKVVKGCFQV